MSEHINALPAGFRLDEYEVLRVLGWGGFGVTYLCFDHNLDQPCAIKEYLPIDLATRGDDNTVRCKSSTAQKDFTYGRDCFLEEARAMAKFKHRNIIQVFRYFDRHETAYIVMEYAEGETLAAILDRKEFLTEGELRHCVLPILEGLEQVHKEEFLHRDIKPDNIIIRDADRSPVLIDFGAARQTLATKTMSMTAIITPPYAPLEQYSSLGKQGPWTDIYSLGMLCYRALSGKRPLDAPMRVQEDLLPPLAEVTRTPVSPGLLHAIERAMRIHGDERPQSVAEWLAMFDGRVEAAPAAAQPPRGAGKGGGRWALGLAGLASTGVAAAAAFYLWGGQSPVPQADGSEVQPLQEVDLVNSPPFPSPMPAGFLFKDSLSSGGFGPAMVVVPPGRITIGSARHGVSDEQPEHEVVLARPFALSRSEITFAEFEHFTATAGMRAPDDGGWGRGDQPVINVNWNDAQRYARWLSEQSGQRYRLANEAEWEYAARGGSSSDYGWGTDIGVGKANCQGCGGELGAGPMTGRQFAPNAFGLFDMHGNVWEWVEDCARDSYHGAPTDGSAWAADDEECSKVLRGGSWRSPPGQLRSAFRNWYPRGETDETVGIRLAREL